MSRLVSYCCGDSYSEDDDEYVCDYCLESFEEPEIDWERDERIKESIMEMMEDEKRDLGIK